jgi:hypothetical protein
LALFVVVADMVFKPTFSNWLLIVIMIAVVLVAAYLFLRPVLMPVPTAIPPV